MISHIIHKVSLRAFDWCGWTNTYVVKLPKIGTTPVLVYPKQVRHSLKRVFSFYCEALRQLSVTIAERGSEPNQEFKIIYGWFLRRN